jgi:penicillin amidase
VNNFTSVDVEGNISYRTVGRIPVRDVAALWGPVPGGDPRFAWTGVVPYETLPRLRNPESGLIVTANQRIVDDAPAQPLGLDYASADRALRLHELLDEMRDATVEGMADVHRDVRSVAADVWVEHLGQVAPGDDWERAALERLTEWDRTMSAESVGAAVYAVTRDSACKILAHHPAIATLRAPFPDEPPGTFQPLELRIWAVSTGLLAAGDSTLLPRGQSWADVLGAALADGVGVLRARLGDDVDAWQWGGIHVASPRHPMGIADPERARNLDPPPVAMGGERDTVMCAAHPVGHGFGVTSTSVARYVFDAGDWDRSAWIVPLGTSGDPTSPHFADQQDAWGRGDLVPMRYTWPSIEAASTMRLRLIPG